MGRVFERERNRLGIRREGRRPDLGCRRTMGVVRSTSEVLGGIVRPYNPPTRRSGQIEMGKLACFHGEQDSLKALAFTPGALPEDAELWSNKDFRALYEFQAASQYHVLVLPRQTLLRGPADLRSDHLDMLRGMLSVAEQLVSVLMGRDPTAACFRAGFHRLPVQNVLHLHLLSMDLKSVPSTKAYNSFTSRFLIDLEEAIEEVKQHGRLKRKETAALNYMAQMPRCPRCGYTASISNIRAHLPICARAWRGQRQLLRLGRNLDSDFVTNMSFRVLARKAHAKAARAQTRSIVPQASPTSKSGRMEEH